MKTKKKGRPVLFGSYEFNGSFAVENLSRMATDVVTTVQALLRQAGEEGEAPQPEELLAAGCLLEWASDYLAWHGLDGDKALEERARQWKATQRAIHAKPSGGRRQGR
jgi:hypothetical protein